MACNSHGHPAIGRSCSIDYLAPAYAGEAVTATAAERSAVGRGAIYDVAVTRDADGQLLTELRAHSPQLAARPSARPEAVPGTSAELRTLRGRADGPVPGRRPGRC